MHFWNTSTGARVNSIDTGSQVTSLIWSREYKEILSTHGFPGNQVSLWSYPSLAKICDLEGHDMRILGSAISPDGQTVLTGAADEDLKFWNAWEFKKGGKREAAVRRGAGGADELVEGMKKVYIR
jgi:cell division cycle protein 20 (cofactor of APC complex)